MYLLIEKIKVSHNSSYKKLVVSWLIEAFVLGINFMTAESLVLRSSYLLITAKRKEKDENCL